MSYSEQSDREREAIEVECEMATSTVFEASETTGDYPYTFEMDYRGNSYTGEIISDEHGFDRVSPDRFSRRMPDSAKEELLEQFQSWL